MRLTIGKKLNFFLVILLLLSVIGTVISATDLFKTDITGLLRKGTLDATALISSKVKSELVHLADRSVLLATASFKEFKNQAVLFEFIKEGISREKDVLSVALYRWEKDRFSMLWRIIHPKDAPTFKPDDYARIDHEAPPNLLSASKGQIAFTSGTAKENLGLIRIALPLVEQTPGIYSYVLVTDVKWEKFQGMLRDSAHFSSTLIDRNGRILASTHPMQDRIGSEFNNAFILQAIEKSGGLASQVDFTDSKGQPLIGSFQKVGFGDLAVVTQISGAEVERTEEQLYRRSVLLGGVFLFFALAISFQLARAIVKPIRALSSAAEKISQGDFSVRVNVKGKRKGDEIKVLSRTFNTMTEKIGELLVQQVAKARMEKELETARAIQDMYCPENTFLHRNLGLAGKVVAATECGGDWWHYSELGESLLVVMGDVTGHGVSAALMTASAHGAFSVCLKEMQSELRHGRALDPERWLDQLARQINTAILGTSRGRAGMTFIASMVNLKTGRVDSINYGHLAPFVYRKGAKRNYLKLTEIGHPALGETDSVNAKPTQFQLKPGDLILWYTDGLIECKGQAGYGLSKSRLLEVMGGLANAPFNEPAALRDELLNKLDETLGAQTKERDDDITIALARVPRSAAFKDDSDLGQTA